MFCGHPASRATAEERRAWELEQWRARELQDTASASNAAGPLDSRGPATKPAGGPPQEPEPWPLEAPMPSPARALDRSPDARSKSRGPGTHAKPEGIVIDLRARDASALVRGRSRGRPATLLINRVTVFLDRAGRGRLRWIPLEEIDEIKQSASALIIESTAERIRLECRDPGVIARAARILTVASAEAKLGFRHDPDVMQAWCELTSDLWKGSLSRHRIKARKLR